MTTAHISEAEAICDFARLLARVRAGEEIIIESGNAPIVILSPVANHSARLHSKPVAQTEARSKKPGFDWESLKRDRDEGRP